jgi:NADH-quinone oxidoreductase subunit J
MLTLNDYLFYILATMTIVSALGVLNFKNPIYSALSLVMTMISIAGLFVGLNAYFLAGVQVAVYAGAVMVLFIMVIMLFDLRKEDKAFSGSALSAGLKISAAGLLCGLVVWAALYSTDSMTKQPLQGETLDSAMTTKTVAALLYSKYVFGFEAISVLLLMVVVGAIALARSDRGGSDV